MKKILCILLAVLCVAASVMQVSAAQVNPSVQRDSMSQALVILFAILGVLALCCLVFTVVYIVAKNKRTGGATILLFALYLATLIVLVCTLFCNNRFAEIENTVGVPTNPSTERATNPTTEATTVPATIETEVIVPPEATIPTLSPAHTEHSDPDNWGVNWQLYANGGRVESYQSPEEIFFGDAKDYYPLPGVPTFRGDNYRSGAAYGTADIAQEELSKIWNRNVGSLNGWPGIGWTGQPLIVQWDAQTKAIMNLYPEKKAKTDLVEVIATTLDGYIYFYDLADGSYTRDPLWMGMSFKGTASLDPRGYPILYAGSGLNNGDRYPRMFIINLIDGTLLMERSGGDDFAYRGWYAFDSSPMISAENDLLIWPGESGVLYSIKLNTQYDPDAGTLTMDPQTLVKTRYATSANRTVGYESSSVIVGSYLYLGDNGGMMYCVDLNTMALMWAQNTKDDVNATPVFAWEEDGKGYLYTATSMEYSNGTAYIYKLDATNGEIVWTKTYSGIVYDYDVSGGVLSSPVLGKPGTDLEGLIIYTIAKTPSAWSGTIVALNTADGSVAWEKRLDNYCWSSPVGVYTDNGKGYILQGDSVGHLYLIDGATGEILYTEGLESNIEASPVVFEDMLVVGTRAGKVWGVKLQ